MTPKPPGAWRVLPLLAGLAELGFWVVRGAPKTVPGQVQALLPGFALVMAGLVLAGPWLTMAGARIMARRTSRAPTLIAARRLADNPRAAFRAVSGLVLALFITTVAAATISTQDAKDGTTQVGGATASNILVDDMNQAKLYPRGGLRGAPGTGLRPSAPLLARLRGIHGVERRARALRGPGPYPPRRRRRSTAPEHDRDRPVRRPGLVRPARQHSRPRPLPRGGGGGRPSPGRHPACQEPGQDHLAGRARIRPAPGRPRPHGIVVATNGSARRSSRPAPAGDRLPRRQRAADLRRGERRR